MLAPPRIIGLRSEKHRLLGLSIQFYCFRSWLNVTPLARIRAQYADVARFRREPLVQYYSRGAYVQEPKKVLAGSNSYASSPSLISTLSIMTIKRNLIFQLSTMQG